MKKYIAFALVFILTLSCEQDVKFNNPAFQGLKDNLFWRGIATNATLGAGGSVIINAYSRNEVVTLKINSTALKTYVLGTSSTVTATYVIKEGTISTTFATGNGIGDGEIVVTEFDTARKTISGTFRFNAEITEDNPLFGSTLNFQQGVFYKVPIIP